MREVTITAHVDAPPETVFAAIADPRKPFLTSNPFTTMAIGGERAMGVATVYRWTFKLPFSPTFQFDEVVTEWLEPEKFAYRAVTGWKMEAVNALAPEDGSTRITFSLRYRLPTSWGWLLPRPLVRLGLRLVFANLRKCVEPVERGRGVRWRLATVLTITLISAGCFVAIKTGAHYAPPLRFAALRLLGGGGVLLLPFVHQPLVPPHSSWLTLAVLALAASSVAYGAMFASPGRAGAGLAAVLGNTQPLFVLGLAVPLLGEQMTRGKWLALVLGLIGILFVAAPAPAAPGAFSFEGAALALAAAAGLALGSVLDKRLGVQDYLFTLTTWQLLLGSQPLLLTWAYFEADAPVRWTPRFVGSLLFLAVPGTAFLTAAWYELVQRGEIGRLSLFFYLVPILGLLVAALLLSERIAPVQGLGVAVILAGTLALVRKGVA